MAEEARGELADVLAAAARALSTVTTVQETLDVIACDTRSLAHPVRL